MNSEDRKLIVETLGEMRQLKGEMKEFKEHVIGRVKALEKKEGTKQGTAYRNERCNRIGGIDGEHHC